jgi:uncharacterized repeat protein (TIGR03803 family)
MLLVALAAITSAQAQTYSVLHTFTGPDGASPAAGVTLDTQGNLFGTTLYGGTSNYGTVFKLDKTGKKTLLHSFTGTPDGAFPGGPLVMDAQGNLYGSTNSGGVSGNGTVFEVNSTDGETALYSFTGGADGGSPNAGLVLDAKGNLYGTTYGGGGHLYACENTPCGTVFRVSRAQGIIKETRLYSFTGKADGGKPKAGLVRDTQGNLYGTSTYFTGLGWGTVFKVSLGTRWQQTVLHSFTGGPDTGPVGGLVLDAQGNLYGTTNGAGTYGYGTVFKLDTNGKETVLYSFTGGVDGANPQAGLVLDAQGNLFGTTVWGGDTACDAPYGCGTVFKVDASGHETMLHGFTGGADGAFPYAGLVLDAQGTVYGTTFNGGLNSCRNGSQGVGCGVVFKLTP